MKLETGNLIVQCVVETDADTEIIKIGTGKWNRTVHIKCRKCPENPNSAIYNNKKEMNAKMISTVGNK